jgi:hypothetical protein
MKRYVVIGIAVLLAFIAGVALTLVAMPFVQSRMLGANQENAPGMMRGGMMMRRGNSSDTTSAPMGMRCGMMGGNCADANADASANPATPVAPTSIAPAQATVAPQPTQSANALPANAKTGKAGNLNVVLVMNPQPAAFSTTTFDITITDEKGAAVSDANVSLDLTMPSMWMPSNKPQAQSLGNGKYQAAGRFTMRGGWRIDIIIERGGQKQNVYFDIGL